MVRLGALAVDACRTRSIGGVAADAPRTASATLADAAPMSGEQRRRNSRLSSELLAAGLRRLQFVKPRRICQKGEDERGVAARPNSDRNDVSVLFAEPAGQGGSSSRSSPSR